MGGWDLKLQASDWLRAEGFVLKGAASPKSALPLQLASSWREEPPQEMSESCYGSVSHLSVQCWGEEVGGNPLPRGGISMLLCGS